MKNSLLFLTLSLGTYLLTSCATSPALSGTSVSPATAAAAAAAADANGDGVITDAEFQKYKQATGQVSAPSVDGARVVDGVNKTTRTLRDSLWTAQLLRNFL